MNKEDQSDLLNMLRMVRRRVSDEPCSIVSKRNLEEWIDRWVNKLNNADKHLDAHRPTY